MNSYQKLKNQLAQKEKDIAILIERKDLYRVHQIEMEYQMKCNLQKCQVIVREQIGDGIYKFIAKEK